MMKCLTYIRIEMLIALCGCQCVVSPCRADENCHPRQGVVLSGDGAKGVTHIGELRILEEAGLLKGDDIPLTYRNVLGGEVPSRYLEQLFPFNGDNYVEFARNVLLSAEMNLRYRIHGKHYIPCIGNVTSNMDKLRQIGQGKTLYGVEMNYTFDSLFDPLGLTAGHSNLTDNFYEFVNVRCNF